ncbi:PLP-dependent aminotransferase family protein [Ottowia testudinis]|uniref:PLP-dependent aminotransferase family protein n=1 Tax=Ottowia testudinis TaxID=2816950 RepID=A0A975H5G1_9BURK|nr:PLP-dependent aminotransferase family protein [Ottowia testudinis]QTD44912.1 PLP-dependent aminotransferase family protein [Ottowia testudinis]
MPEPLYRQIAGDYLAAITAGSLQRGDRFPSVRQIMQTRGVSMSTAVQVCHALEDAGHLQARPRSGYYVQAAPRACLRPPPEVGAPVPLPAGAYEGLNGFISEFLARSERVPGGINFGTAVGRPDMYPMAALQRIAASVLRQRPQVFTTTARRYGHPDFTGVLARRAVMRGMALAPEQITVTHGCAEAIHLALRATCRPGDVVAIESPAFHGMLQLLPSLGLTALELPTSPVTGLSVEALELALHQQAPRIKAVLAVPTVHNPLGCSMPPEAKAALVALCVRYGVTLIEDDSYSELDSEQALARPAKAWDAGGDVIYCASLNKVLAPGMRLGWMAAGRWQARVEMLKYTQSRFPEELGQQVLARFMDSSAYDRHLRRMQQSLRVQRQHMADAVATHFGPQAALHVPSGGLMLWLKLPGGVSATRLANAALEEGIRTIPGSLCSALPRFDGYMRLSCGAVTPAQIDAGVARLAALAQQQTGGPP